MADAKTMQITTKVSPGSVTETTSRLTDILAAKGLLHSMGSALCRNVPGTIRA